MCARCEQLEAEVQFLRAEMGLAVLTAERDYVRRAYHLTPNEAWLVLSLHQAKGKTLSHMWLLENLPSPLRLGLDRITNNPSVYVARVRKKLGHDTVTTVRTVGFMAGPALAAMIEAAMPARAA